MFLKGDAAYNYLTSTIEMHPNDATYILNAAERLTNDRELCVKIKVRGINYPKFLRKHKLAKQMEEATGSGVSSLLQKQSIRYKSIDICFSEG